MADASASQPTKAHTPRLTFRALIATLKARWGLASAAGATLVLAFAVLFLVSAMVPDQRHHLEDVAAQTHQAATADVADLVGRRLADTIGFVRGAALSVTAPAPLDTSAPAVTGSTNPAEPIAPAFARPDLSAILAHAQIEDAALLAPELGDVEPWNAALSARTNGQDVWIFDAGNGGELYTVAYASQAGGVLIAKIRAPGLEEPSTGDAVALLDRAARANMVLSASNSAPDAPAPFTSYAEVPGTPLMVERTSPSTFDVAQMNRALWGLTALAIAPFGIALAMGGALVKQARRASSGARAKTTFLANMSHELRTPLNAIVGFSHIMKEEFFGPLGDERYKDYANDIAASGEYLTELLSDILDMARIETGEHQIHVETTDPNALARECTSLMADRASEKQLSLRANVEGLPPIQADPRAFKQILLCLLSNAIKFTPAGGHVEVAAEQNGPKQVSFRVADNGVGISPSDLSRLGRPFEPLESSDTKQSRGTGLGLALSKRLVEMHGGHLSIASTLDKGTTVSFTLPQ